MPPDAVQIADLFHLIKLANSKLDEVRRRVQNETFGHRGRKPDPLYRARKLLVMAEERPGNSCCGDDRAAPGRTVCALRTERDVDLARGLLTVSASSVVYPDVPLQEIPTKNRRHQDDRAR